jgi:hypothetical protein
MIRSILLTTSLLFAGHSFGAVLLSDNFDTGAANADWSRKSNLTFSAGGPTGSTNYTTVVGSTNTANGLGDQIGGANNFVIDFYFQVRNDAVNRQFNLGISTASLNPSPGDAAVNLRIQNGAFAVYQGSSSSWQTVSTLGSVAAGQWYHMQVEGTGWGSAGASYTLRLSDAGGSAFTSIASNLTTIQNGQINGSFVYNSNSFSGLAQSFLFTTAYGGNPGFDVDNVTVTGDLVPEPSTVMLSGVAALFLVRRNRRG